MWMSGTVNFLVVFAGAGTGLQDAGGGLQRAAALLAARQRGNALDLSVKARPVAALALEERLEGGHQVVVGTLRAEGRVVGACHPAVVGVLARAGPARLQLGVALAKVG